MRFELSSRQKHMAHLGLRVGAGWGARREEAEQEAVALSEPAYVHQRLLWRPKNKTEKGRKKKKKRETPFLTFWRTHVVAHFDEPEDDDEGDDEHDDDGHVDDNNHVVQDCHAEGLVVVSASACVCLDLHLVSRVRFGFVCSSLHGGYTDPEGSIIAHPQQSPLTESQLIFHANPKTLPITWHLSSLPRSLARLASSIPHPSYNNQQRQQKFIFIGRRSRALS